MRVTRALLAHAGGAASMVLRGDAPADQLLSRYFREHRNLGQNDRAFVAETVFAVLRRKRSLEAASGSSAPHALVAAALLRVLGHSARSMQGLIDEKLLARDPADQRFRVATGGARGPARLVVGASRRAVWR